MFCNEPIIAAYEGSREYRDIDGANSFFDCYHELAYHVTEGYRIVLETEYHYISLGIRGVELCEKTGPITDLEESGEWLEPYIHTDVGEVPWVDYQSTLFVGERLQSVERASDHYLLQFDDFALKLVPHALGEEDFPSLKNKYHYSYNYVLGAERHIKRACDCGGSGELLLDFVCDYLVRCKKCGKSTWASMLAQEAIEDWNQGKTECDATDITLE